MTKRLLLVPLVLALAGCPRPMPEPDPAPAPVPAAAPATPAPAPPAEPAAPQAATDAARAAGERWLLMVDEGDYRRSWNEAAQMFRVQVTAEQWDQALSAARAPLGAVHSREAREAQALTQLPGAPEGEYVVLVFSTRFEAGERREQLVMMREADGEWRAVGYFAQQ